MPPTNPEGLWVAADAVVQPCQLMHPHDRDGAESAVDMVDDADLDRRWGGSCDVAPGFAGCDANRSCVRAPPLRRHH